MNKKNHIRLTPREFAYFVVGFKVFRNTVEKVDVPTIAPCLTRGDQFASLYKRVNNKINHIKSKKFRRRSVNDLTIYSKKINSCFLKSKED